MSKLHEKITDSAHPIIFYELTPPTRDINKAGIQAYVECAAELVTSTSYPIDAFNLPEIHSEKRNGDRVLQYQYKMDPRELALQLRAVVANDIDVTINRCTVREHLAGQEEWLNQTSNKFAIKNLILVGGESSQVSYLGPSIPEMLQLIQSKYQQKFFCGGITIPTRRKPNTTIDEPLRLYQKAKSGIDFFTSQVLYDADGMQKLLKDYHDLCVQKNVLPKRIFLSFAPVSSQRDIDFLKWLGVVIPKTIEDRLLKASIGIGWRSIQVAKEILNEILQFVAAESISVPLGLNIEHITHHNFEISKELIEQLGSVYYDFQ